MRTGVPVLVPGFKGEGAGRPEAAAKPRRRLWVEGSAPLQAKKPKQNTLPVGRGPGSNPSLVTGLSMGSLEQVTNYLQALQEGCVCNV